MKQAIERLTARQSLTESEMQDLMSMFPQAPIEQQAAVLALLSAKGETTAEILGARAALMQCLVSLQPDSATIDIVGTGGDGKGVFNVSTAASLLVASCGVPVAKHGGRAATSRSGSMDVIEQLHVPVCQSIDEAMQGLHQHHYAYLWAPVFHPHLASFAVLRQHLAIPTLFNILGPVMNPLQPQRQVIGVYRRALVPVVAEVLKQLGSVHALVVHSDDGLDELSVSSATYYVELKQNLIGNRSVSSAPTSCGFERVVTLTEGEVTPEEIGLTRFDLHAVLGGSAVDNAGTIEGILFGDITGAKRDMVLLNAAAGLLVAGRVSQLAEGVAVAREQIESGKTRIWMNALRCRRE